MLYRKWHVPTPPNSAWGLYNIMCNQERLATFCSIFVEFWCWFCMNYFILLRVSVVRIMEQKNGSFWRKFETRKLFGKVVDGVQFTLFWLHQMNKSEINWAAPFEFHTPPVEHFGKRYYREGYDFKIYLPSVWFSIRFITEGVNIHFEFPNELMYLKFTSSSCFLNLPQRGCEIQIE